MKRNYVLSFITIFLLSFISVAYAAFNSELVITGEGTVQKDTTAPTCGAWYFRDSSLSTQQAYDQNKFINPGTNTTWTSTDKTLFIECTDNMPGEYGCINVDVITDSNNNPRYFKDVKEYTTSIQTDSNVVTVTLKDAYLNERTCTLPVGGSNPYIDKQDPEITITRSAANKFTYSATDNMGVQGYMVTTTATQPALDSENWISTPAEVTIDNTAAKTYYVWAKDGTNIVSSTIKTFKLTKTQGTGTTLTLRYGDSNGATLGTQFVLDGTEVYALAAPNTGYNTVLLKKGSTTLETGTGTASVNSTQTITAATTISSSATVNTYTINFNANGGTGSMASQLMTYGNTTALTTNTFTRVGYTFAGWNTKADGTGTNYTDGQNVSNLVTTNNGSVTLYAKWTANSYTVTANSKSGSIPSTTGWTGTGNTSTKSVTYDSAYGTLPTPTRNGYTFAGWSLLPEGYTQVEYIESNGNQHINTGVTPDATTEIIIDFYTSTNGKWILGSRLSGGTANSFGIYLQSTTQYWAQIGGSEATNGGYVTVSSISGRHVIDVSGYSFKLDDEVKITYNNSISPTNAKDLYIFTMNTNGSADSRKMIGKVYSTKIYKNGNVVRDLVPCINDSTGKAGMYDIVNGVFYGNAGTGDFTAGNASYITSETIVKESRNHNIYAKWTANSYTVTANSNGGSIPSTTGWTGTGNTSTKSVIYDSAYGTLPTPTRNGYEFAGWSLLPEGYTQVEYIESTGTQYIATNAAIFNKATHEIIIDFEPTQFYNYNQLYGSTTDNDTFESWIYSNGNLHSRYNGGVYGNQNTLTVNTRYLINFIKSESNLYKYVDGSLIPGGATTVNTSTSTGTLTLFKSGSDYSKYKLYGAKIYANGELVRDYIPCINNSTGKAGLYDIANGVFYGNAGTDDFTAGNASYITSETIVKESRNHNIYAKWTANSYTVTANSNGGSIPSTTGWTGTGNTSTKNVTYGATYGTLPTPTRTGYTFVGWSKNLLNLNVSSSVPSNTSSSNTTPRTFTLNSYVRGIAYNNYYAPSNVSDVTVDDNSVSFTGTGGYGVAYPILSSSNKTYVISYTAATTATTDPRVSILFYKENGEFISYSQKIARGATTYSFTTPADTYYIAVTFTSGANSGDYSFTNIQLEEGTTPTAYQASYITSSSSVITSGNHTLYAQWARRNYVLTINPAGGTFNGSTSSQLVTQEFESTYNIASTPTKTGYTFTGWLLSGTGSFKYYDDTVTPTETVVKNYDAANSTMPNVYNNKGNGTVTRQMVVDSTATGGYSLSVVTNGEASPNAGGVNLDIWPTTPDRVNVLEIRAKIPTGYNITLGGIGTSYTGYGSNWRANDRAGNDEWKTYQLVVYTGTQGSFAPRAYIYLIGTDNTSVSWNIDSITMKSYTKAQYNSIYTFGAGNATLTAQWGTSGSKVTWDKQGGTFGNGTIGTKWTAVASYFTYTSAYTATKLAPYYISENEFAFYKTGYTFDGWYTASTGGTQVFDASGQLNASVTGYSDANKKWQKYENLTLYARWIPNELTFDNQTITKTFSTSSQTANVTVATNGTGTYTYSKVSGESDITVSSAGVITIPASKTANTTGYTVVIRATDSNSGATKDATYTIKINKKKATITRTDASKALTYPVAGTNAYTYDGDGTLSCTSSNTAYVTCSVDTTNGNIIVTPVKPTSSAITITLSATAGTNYSAPDNKTFTVTVAKGTLTATATALNGTYSGSAQYAKIKVTKSDWDGATIVSGTTTSYGQSVTTSGVYNTNYNLKPGYTNVQAQTTIYYKITGGTYYNDLEGSTTATIGKKKATITLTDSSKSLTYPTGGSNTYTYDGAATPTCSSSNSTYVTCSVDATNHKINVTAVKPTSSAITITVSATEASNSNYSSPDNKTFTVTVAKGTCPAPTNVAIATDKKVTWTNATGASSYQISMNSSSGFAAHTNGNAYNSITDATGTRTVYVRSVCDTDYYSSANSSNASASTTVYSVTLTKGTGVSDVKLDGTSVSAAKNYITGATAELDATVFTGYTWTNWTGSSTIATKSTSITVNGNKSYTANATANKYTITYNYNNAAIITFASGEYAETGYYIDWDSDFTINGVWRYGTAAKRYLVIGNYDDGTGVESVTSVPPLAAVNHPLNVYCGFVTSVGLLNVPPYVYSLVIDKPV